MSQTLGSQVARGALVKLLGGVPVNILALVLTLIAARILVPSEYGTYTLAAAIYGLSDILTNPAVATYLIRNPDSTDHSINAAWTASAVRGLFLSAILFFIAPYLSSLFDGGPKVTLLLRIMSTAFIAQGLKNLHSVRFHQRLEMTRVLLVDSLGTAVSSILGIVLLYITRDVMALAVAAAGGPWLNALFSWVFSKRARFVWDTAEWGAIWRFTRFLLLNGLIHYALLNLDDLMVAKLSDKAALGLYSLSYAIVNAAVLFFVRPLADIMLPTLARLRDKPPRLAEACVAAVSVFAAASWAITSYGWVLSDDLFNLLSDRSEWAQAAPVFRALLPFVLIRGVNNALGALVLAAGQPRQLTLISGVQLLLMIPIGLLGYVASGYLGLIIAITALNGLAMLALTWLAPRLAPVSSVALLLTIFAPMPAALCSGFAVAWVTGYVHSPLGRVLLGLLAAVIVFTVTWELTCRTRVGALKSAESFMSLLQRIRARRAGASSG